MSWKVVESWKLKVESWKLKVAVSSIFFLGMSKLYFDKLNRAIENYYFFTNFNRNMYRTNSAIKSGIKVGANCCTPLIQCTVSKHSINTQNLIYPINHFFGFAL
mgnify:CR=1 FL=1